MEEDGEETPRSPFWIQSTTNLRRAERYRRRISSLFFNSGVLVVLLLLLAVVSMVFIIPSLISFGSHIFRPNSVKKSWDSINLVLVLFALAFGFLSRNINNDHKSSFDNGFDRSRSDLSTGAPISSSTPHQWYDFPEQPIGFNTGLRRHRSSSSYPDLRELSPPWNHRAGDPWRFSDDTYLNSHRVLDADRYYLRREQDPEIKDVVHVDTVVDLHKEDSYTPPSPPPVPEDESYPPPSPPPPVPEPPAPTHTVRNRSSDINKMLLPETQPPVTAQSLPSFQHSDQQSGSGIRKRGKGERRARSSEPRKMPSPEPSSPPHILPDFQDSGQKTGRVERKRNSANATKEFFTSFYQKKKKKRQRHKSVDNLDALLHRPQPSPVIFQPPPPAPPSPPPPPPPSVLNNLFSSKKERRKKLQSASPAPRAPPPPPPLPPPPARSAGARAPKPTTTRVSPFVTEKPRLPVKMNVFSIIDDSSSGGESPLGRIPPPPPMPPFKMSDWKFAVEGDYVRLQSTLSSGSGSPDGDEARSPTSDAGAWPIFCPSPDVDTKADSFIARFRAGLKLEKVNSFNQNQGLRMSNLGPGSSPKQR